ncbi:MAG: hypothetical protein IPM38_15775 [Ignavibacteria bacterium]|nr:hypothetical protein [Ignavibacteria bacterium]
MKKLISITFVILILCFNVNAFAQVALYSFTQNNGSYNEITGDTTVAISTSTITNPMNLDDVTYPSNSIPFSFRFNGAAYTAFAINSNGFITFGVTPPVAANYGPIAATETYDGAVSGFGANLIGIFGTNADRVAGSLVLSNVVSFAGVVAGRLITGTGIAASATIISFDQSQGTILMSAAATSTGTGEIIQIASASIVRGTTGAAGNRIHTIQFKNFKRNITTGTIDNLNFQIKLYEATGKIEVVYGNIDQGPISVLGQVGLRGILASDFNNRTTSSNWLTTTAGATNDVQCLISSTVYPASGLTFIWGPPTANANIKVIPEGFYNPFSEKLNMRDTVRVYLHNVTSPYAIVDSGKSVIDSVTFSGSFIFSNAPNGTYYLAVKHRNTIETWSKAGGESITNGGTLNYDFTNLITKAYGNNMIQADASPVRFAIYSGDVNQDGTVDLADGSLIDNDAFNFASGYISTDVNGDGIVDVADAVYADNNGFNFVGKITP